MIEVGTVSIPSQVGILLVAWGDVFWRSGRDAVSIPSQVGILLVAVFPTQREREYRMVSIPSQVGILLVGTPAATPTAGPAARLNTLSGGHPLGGVGGLALPAPVNHGLNTLSGGHPLGG